MTNSILDSTKKSVGLTVGDAAFDIEILMFINATFSTLTQLGLGPVEGFSIEDNTTTWDAFLGDDKTLNDVKLYMTYRVRMAFDPPATSFHIAAIEKQLEELTFRLSVTRENKLYEAALLAAPPVVIEE